MKHIPAVLVTGLLFTSGQVYAARPAKLPLTIYSEASHGNPAYVPSGYMGTTTAIEMNPNWKSSPHSGKTCLRVVYSGSDQWGGVMWQSPPNDWGFRPGGWDLTGAKLLTFWARGEHGGEVVNFQYGGISGRRYNDTATARMTGVKLTSQWKKYSFRLSGDLSQIKTGFAWAVTTPGKPVTFYLDDIQYE